MKYILALVLLISNAAHADFDTWSPTDKGLFVANTVVTVIDWGQTRYISKHPEQYREMNPWLGPHPSTQNVDLFFVASLVGTYYLADRFPTARGPILLGLTIGRGMVVKNNIDLGVKMGF